jgi:hypothetical protein
VPWLQFAAAHGASQVQRRLPDVGQRKEVLWTFPKIPESGVKTVIGSRAASVGGSFRVFRALGLVRSGIL